MLWQMPSSKLYYRVCRFLLFFLAASASFNGFYEQCHFHEVGVPTGWNVDGFEEMVDGTAYRPYIYRQLLPTAANWMDKVVPETIKTRLYNYQGKYPEAYINSISDSPAANNRTYFFRYLITYIATFLFALLAVYAMYFVCKALAVSRPAAMFAPVIAILLLPYVMNDSGFNYDYPELAFMALAVGISIKFDWWWCIPIAALGTWNKESFLLFIPTLYPLFRRRNSRFGALISVAVLCSICAAVYLPTYHRFSHNPGSVVVVQWLDHLQSLAHPRMLLFTTQQA